METLTQEIESYFKDLPRTKGGCIFSRKKAGFKVSFKVTEEGDAKIAVPSELYRRYRRPLIKDLELSTAFCFAVEKFHEEGVPPADFKKIVSGSNLLLGKIERHTTSRGII